MVIYSSAMRKNTLPVCATTWVNLTNITEMKPDTEEHMLFDSIHINLRTGK